MAYLVAADNHKISDIRSRAAYWAGFMGRILAGRRDDMENCVIKSFIMYFREVYRFR